MYATLSKEYENREKEFSALCDTVANMKQGRRDKQVEKSGQTEVKGVLVAGTRTETRIYGSILT